MPTYLLHGFRWHRANIRIHVIVNDLEDAAPEWIVAPATSVTLLNSFYTLFDFLPPSTPPPASYSAPIISNTTKEEPLPIVNPPTRTLKKKYKSMGSIGRKSRPASLSNTLELITSSGGGNGRVVLTKENIKTSVTAKSERSKKQPAFNDWSVVKLVEQYDPDDMFAVSQPYAYVADYMVEVGLGVSVTDEMAKYEARMRVEEDIAPNTPSSSKNGDLASPALSARDIRRKSRRLGWFEKLKDGLEKGENLGWYVVYCGDVERESPLSRDGVSMEQDDIRSPKSAGLRGFFNRRRISGIFED